MLNPQEAIERRKLIQECLASQVIDIRSGIHQGLRGREKPGGIGCCVKRAWPGSGILHPCLLLDPGEHCAF